MREPDLHVVPASPRPLWKAFWGPVLLFLSGLLVIDQLVLFTGNRLSASRYWPDTLLSHVVAPGD